jgi:hypothetical protein
VAVDGRTIQGGDDPPGGAAVNVPRSCDGSRFIFSDYLGTPDRRGSFS